MAKVKVVVTHEEYGEFDLGDVTPGLLVDGLSKGNWSLSDIGGDWKVVKYEVDGKEFEVSK